MVEEVAFVPRDCIGAFVQAQHCESEESDGSDGGGDGDHCRILVHCHWM